MKNMNWDYIISEKVHKEFNNILNIGKYKFHCNNENLFICRKNDKDLIIFGNFVDSHNFRKGSEEILNDLCEAESVEELIEESKKIAGRFLIVYKNKSNFIVLPDASCSIPATYSSDHKGVTVSSNPEIIASINNYKEAALSREIKKSGGETQPLPYDLSMYDEIKIIIPNNYLDCTKSKMIRYYPLHGIQQLSIEEVTQKSVRILGNITKGFSNNMNISIPITSGIDSRTILALFKENIDEIPLYTFLHENFSPDNSELSIPKDISTKYNLDYNIIPDISLSQEAYDYYKKELGSNFNSVIARNAFTYSNSKLSNYTFITGDIIPLVKSNFGKNLPEFLATNNYLVTKTHNYSKNNKLQVKRWLKDISIFSKKSKVSKFDLFFWEHRVGKWTSNNLMNYDLLVSCSNIFNCRELIESWLCIPRKERVNKSIHKEIIKATWPELLEYPINPGEKYKVLHQNSLFYYTASFIKYWSDHPILKKQKMK